MHGLFSVCLIWNLDYVKRELLYLLKWSQLCLSFICEFTKQQVKRIRHIFSSGFKDRHVGIALYSIFRNVMVHYWCFHEIKRYWILTQDAFLLLHLSFRLSCVSYVWCCIAQKTLRHKNSLYDVANCVTDRTFQLQHVGVKLLYSREVNVNELW